MSAQPWLVAVDWGSSELRLWLLDREGAVLAFSQAPAGALRLGAEDFAPTLAHHLAQVQAPPGLPVLMCGMVGSRQGWLEVPYQPAQLPLGDLARHARPVAFAGHEVRILPGLAQHGHAREDAADVMRGEETQLLGLLGHSHGSAEAPPAQRVCLPGTHSKWVDLADGRVRRFHTFITGEWFGWLESQSSLRDALAPRSAVAPDHPAFGPAVLQAWRQPEQVPGWLFGLRAGHLLASGTAVDPGTARARLSGWLIGAELAAVRADFLPAHRHEPLVLLGAGAVAPLYAHALVLVGQAFQQEDGHERVRQGLMAAARRLWPMSNVTGTGTGQATGARHGR